MKYCGNCGAKLEENVKFCSSCGSKLGNNQSKKDNGLTTNSTTTLTLGEIGTTWNWGSFAMFPIYMTVYNWPLGIGLFIIVIIMNTFITDINPTISGTIIAQILFYIIGIYFGLHGEEFALENWKKNHKDDGNIFLRIQKNWNIIGIIIFVLIVSYVTYLFTLIN